MTKNQLSYYLFAQNPTVVLHGVVGTLQKIEREDGSGKSFNVTILTTKGEKITRHIRIKE